MKWGSKTYLLTCIEMFSKMQSEIIITIIITADAHRGLPVLWAQVKCHLWISTFDHYDNAIRQEYYYSHFRG